MDVYFSTVVRGRSQEEGGELVRLNWTTKEVRGKVPIIPARPRLVDPNPRGNTRGGRGIEISSSEVLVCSYHTVNVFDTELNHIRDVSNYLMVGLHETCRSTADRIWVTSTAIDGLLEIDVKNGEITQAVWPRERSAFQQRLSLIPLDIDKGADNRAQFLDSSHIRHPSHLHLNAVALWQNDIYCLFNRFGVLANLSRDEIVVQDDALRGGHNLLITPDGIAITNDTRGHSVRLYDLQVRAFRRALDLMEYDWVRRLLARHMLRAVPRRLLARVGLARKMVAKPLFVRGLDKVDDLMFVGLSPASILCVDARTYRLVDAYQYATDVNSCVHGLRVTRD